MASINTTVMCVECGIKPCKRGAIKYCSRECSLKNTAILTMYGNHWKGKKMPASVRKKISIAAKGRLPNSGSFKTGIQINLGRVREDIGHKNACWKGRTKRNCDFCSKRMLLAPWEVQDGKRFCSPKCYQTWHRGKNSPVFKGKHAVSRLRNRIATLIEYKAWHAKILKRDGYRCVKCRTKHSKETPLEVDHIKRFFHIVRENKIFTLDDARKCDELWDTSNGQTVCKPCHRTLQTYGTKGLTKVHKPNTKI